jgi:hypothetical protein
MWETLHESVGTLHYSKDIGYRLVLLVDQGISDFYRSLIPKYYPVNKPMYPAHVTVVRAEKETPIHLEHWGKHEGERVLFKYSPIIGQGKVYYWLNIFCSRLEDVRLELGLPVVSEYTLPPEGFRKCFHCTIGNQKDITRT